ncbi:MAG: RDD family protein [Elusimicrobia bacterium]|nr:RDD family protein [Elusimicrobiota bacterium]
MYNINMIQDAEEDLFTYADFMRRVFAYLFDVLVIIMFALSVGIVAYYNQGADYVEGFPRELIYFSFIIAMILYSAVLNASSLRGTLGKFLFKIYVVGEGGKSIGFLRSLLREILKMATLHLLAPLLLFMLARKRRQNLHDIIAKTFVIRKPRFSDVKD